jgi:tetratricopeptide (TPR) repeat protein
MLFALVLSCAALLPADDAGTLEALLQRLRAQEASQVDALRGDVDVTLQRLTSAVASKQRVALDDARAALASLGPRAAPLLAEHLDPGPDGDADDERVALEIARVLAAWPEAPIGARLLETASTGTRAGRLNALHVIAAARDGARYEEVLAALWNEPDPALRAAALVAMARLGGERNAALLREALSSAGPELVGVALDVLTAARASDAAPALLALTQDRARAAQNAPGIVAWYRACPDVQGAEHGRALLGLALDTRVAVKDRVLVMDLLPRFAAGVGDQAVQELRGLASAPDRDLREAALVTLTLLGDRGAKKDLLAPYNRQVDKSKDWSKAYEQRGHALYRVGEYREAIRDFREALRLGPSDPRGKQEEAHVGLARCYAASGKLKEAWQTLRSSPLGRAELQALAAEPVFARMVESSKYADVFGLE